MMEHDSHQATALVLVVDDDMMLRYLAREALELDGLRVQEAADGAAALEQIDQERPAIILLDVHMPVMDGFTLCEKLREQATGAPIPVMMMTAATDMAAIERAYEVGATDFVTKPINWTILTQRLRYTLRASHALERARLSEAKLASAQRVAGLGHWELDLQTNTASWSEEAYRLLGLTVDGAGAAAEAFWKVVHPDDREAVKERRHDAIHARMAYRLDYRLTLPDSVERVVHEQAEILYDANGQPERILGTIQDITERKRAEAALLAGKQAAEQAIRVKSTFMSNVSHEIRTPINGVLGYLQLLQEVDLAKEPRDYVDKAHGAAAHLLTIVDQLLDFSSIKNPDVPIELLDFELRTALDDVLSPLKVQAEHKGLALTCLVQAGVPTWVAGDPGRLRQILTHIVDNAIKFTDVGEVIVRLRLVEHTAQEATIRFEVQDTGIGIPPDAQAGLFQPFFQVDGSATRKYSGTGLGLTIAHGLVERLGGEMGMESEPGVGSTFWFTICLSTCPVPPQSLAADASIIEGKRILCVGDHLASRSSLQAQLKAWGMIVDMADDGPQAIATLRQAATTAQPYDLALLNHRPPDLDGMDLASRIREDMALCSTRLVLLSGFGQRGHGEAAQRVGLSAYLVQPVQPTQLYACLDMVLSPFNDPSTLVTRHRATEARAHLMTWILVAAAGKRQKATVQILQALGCRVDVVDDSSELREALAHRHYAYLILDPDLSAVDAVATAQSIRASTWRMGQHLPIIAIDSSHRPEDSTWWREAGIDAVVQTPLQVEAVLGVLKGIQPARPSSLPTDQSSPSESDISDNGLCFNALQIEYGPELAMELCHLFLSETPDVIAAMRHAWSQGDGLTWQQALLRLQSSCHNLGARSLEQLCRSGAHITEPQASGDSESLVEQLESEFQRLQLLLESELSARELTPII